METRREITKDMVRQAARSFGADGAQFGYSLLYETFSLNTEAEKDIVRSRVNEMTRSGELVRVQNGVFTYNGKHRLSGDSPLRNKVWLFARKAKPGWTVKEASLMTGVSWSHASRYCDWLEQEGYIEQTGKNGTAATYRATSLADRTPEMPQPGTEEKGPFDKECRAAGKITTLLLYGNPYAPKTAAAIAEACKVLLARFGGCQEN